MSAHKWLCLFSSRWTDNCLPFLIPPRSKYDVHFLTLSGATQQLEGGPLPRTFRGNTTVGGVHLLTLSGATPQWEGPTSSHFQGKHHLERGQLPDTFRGNTTVRGAHFLTLSGAAPPWEGSTSSHSQGHHHSERGSTSSHFQGKHHSKRGPLPHTLRGTTTLGGVHVRTLSGATLHIVGELLFVCKKGPPPHTWYAPVHLSGGFQVAGEIIYWIPMDPAWHLTYPSPAPAT